MRRREEEEAHSTERERERSSVHNPYQIHFMLWHTVHHSMTERERETPLFPTHLLAIPIPSFLSTTDGAKRRHAFLRRLSPISAATFLSKVLPGIRQLSLLFSSRVCHTFSSCRFAPSTMFFVRGLGRKKKFVFGELIQFSLLPYVRAFLLPQPLSFLWGYYFIFTRVVLASLSLAISDSNSNFRSLFSFFLFFCDCKI